MNTNRNPILIALLGAAITLGNSRAAEIHDVAAADNIARLGEMLATNRALVHLPGKDDLTPLHSAARAGKSKAVAVLLKHGAEINAADTHGCTPLHSAVYGKHVSMMELLLDHGAKVEAARTDGTTPLYYAVVSGDTNLVALLLKRGATPDAPSDNGATPLHTVAKQGNPAVADLLVRAGAKVEAKDKEGHTPLHEAAGAGNREMVTWLLNHGANADATDRLRRKPVDCVASVTNAALVALLEQHMKPRPKPEPNWPAKVGEVGDPDRIQFEGVHAFTDEQIRHGLAVKPSYLLAAHPQANLRAFLEELASMVDSGYQVAGFPEARVEVAFDADALQVRVKVAEGPRFTNGKIQVVGDKSISRRELGRWFTTRAITTSKSTQTLKTTTTSKTIESPNSDATWSLGASANLTAAKRSGGLATPGKAERPDDPMWVAGEPADFSAAWIIRAEAQVEACLAEAGFFFPKVAVELRRQPATETADLVITVKTAGPLGIIGEITVTGAHRHTAYEIIRFLELRRGKKITADRLAFARQKLRDCGRFRDYEITPEYLDGATEARRRVNLHIGVKEQEGVPHLKDPLPPVQQALLRLCDWLEQFPARDEDIQVTVTNRELVPFTVEFVLSPQRGLLLHSVAAPETSPISIGFLLSQETIEVCAWATGHKLAAPRTGGGSFFLHLLPNKGETGGDFTFSFGGGYRDSTSGAARSAKPLLTFDVQLARAAFLDLATRENYRFTMEGRTLVLANEGFQLRSDAVTGRLLELTRSHDQITVSFKFGTQAWGRASRDFLRRSEPLPNRYTPGHGLSSFLAFVTGEAARLYLANEPAATNASQQQLALAALAKLLNPAILFPVDQILGRNETNHFTVPMDEVDQAMALNSLVAFFSGFAFEWSNEMFPKHSWPWTAARETAFVMMSQGRYTSAELERLYNSEDTGPIGCLALSRLLATSDAAPAKAFAQLGLMRMGAADFLRDCNLLLQGESGLARSFAKLAGVLRTLSEDELAALVTVLPNAEGVLLRESAAALRASPAAAPAALLAPALRKYWEDSLRARVRAAFHRLMTPPLKSDNIRI